ncbi:right-handed parallel beta-helix repeat-containing protein [Halostella sp. PRR32]|uniref:right-handed parallel beta-helix repeat-containing protein n=1 Tax=Halostella sp. PRR32 TaxID=3098147 RepID=UPI0034E0BE20
MKLPNFITDKEYDTGSTATETSADAVGSDRENGPRSAAGAKRSLTRRGCLKSAVATGVTGIGIASTASASSGDGSYSDYFDEYDTVIDMVEAGADNTGSEPITDVLKAHRGDDTLLVFPPGRYYMDEQFRFTGFENFGLLGNDATLVPANYHEFDGPQYRLFRLGVDYSPGRNLLVEGFTVDQTATDTGIRVIDTFVADGLEVRDITVDGYHDSGTWGPGLFNITDPDGSGIVEGFKAPDGAAWVDETPNAGNLWRGPSGIIANQNRGTLTFRHCVLGPFPDNGLYASGGTGTVVVEGGIFKNSNAANVRIGGDSSRVEWVTVEVDDARPQDTSQRAIRLENGDGLRVEGAAVRVTNPMPTSHAISVMNTCEGTRIENSTIDISGDEINQGIVVSPDAGETVIVDTDITHDTTGGYPIWIRESDRTDQVLCEHVTVSGQAGDDGGFRDGIRCERDNCRFNAVTVTQPSDVDRNALVNTGDDCRIYKGEYRASQYPIVDLGSGTVVREVHAESYDGNEGVLLYDQCENAALKKNTLVNGVKDNGCDGLVMWGNTF